MKENECFKFGAQGFKLTLKYIAICFVYVFSDYTSYIIPLIHVS